MKRWIGIVLLVIVVAAAVLGVRAYGLLAWAGEVEPVRFKSGDGVEISGRLIVPDGDGAPYPAIVMLHGSGPHTHGKSDYRLHAGRFVRAGFAVLTYDKRGAGDSGGDFDTSTYDDLVVDGTSAVRFLRTRPEIDGSRIGLLAFSEGGWLAPEVTERASGITFVISRCGPPLSWIDTVIWEVENDRRAEGFEGKTLTATVELTRGLWNYYIDTAARGPEATASRRAELEARIDELNAADPVFARAEYKIGDYDPEKYERWAQDLAYDPTPFLERTTVPMLYVFGETDINVPIETAVRRLDSLRDRGLEIEYRVYPGVGHSLGSWSRFWYGGYPDGYFELMTDWAAKKSSGPAPR